MSIFIERDIEITTDFTFRQRKLKNKSKSNKFTFADSVRSIHLVSRFFGFTPFSFYTKNGEILGARVGIIDILWFIICLTIYGFLIYTCPFRLPTSFGASPSLVYEHYIQLIGGLFKAIFTIILDMINRHRIASILIDLNRFDMRLLNLGIAIDYEKYRKKLHRYQFSILVFVLVMSATLIIASAPQMEGHISTFQKLHFAMANTLHVGGIIAAGTNYVLLVRSLCTRFDIINGLLKHHFQNASFLVLRNNSPQAVVSINFIKQMSALHANQCDTMDTINYCYSIPIMATLAWIFFFSVFTFFVIFRYLLDASEFFELMVKLRVSLFFFFFAYILVILYTSNLVNRKGKKTSQVIHKIINHCNEKSTLLTLTQFSQQLKHQIPIATCGLFDINWTILYSIIASISTYVMILINFEPFHLKDSDVNTVTLSANQNNSNN